MLAIGLSEVNFNMPNLQGKTENGFNLPGIIVLSFCKLYGWIIFRLHQDKNKSDLPVIFVFERARGLEPLTFSLEGRHSTAELRPLPLKLQRVNPQEGFRVQYLL